MEKYPPKQNEVYELKMTSGTSIPFKAVAGHQVDNLLKAELGSFYYRLADQPWGYNPKFRFTLQKPFDCLSMSKSLAYVVVWFYKPRKPKVFIKIRINDFIEMRDQVDRKSFTEEMALSVGETVALTIAK